MSQKRKKTVIFGRTLIAASVVASALAMPMANASAGSLLDFLFGGRRSAPIPNPVAPLLNAFADPSASGAIEGSRRENGPSVAYCVRLCDGHPFPVQSSNASTAQACSSMCPATKTKVFAGGSIDGAVASDGKRYADLPTAFVYRKQLVANCTCNGKSAGGLARMDAKSDPTLRPGDIVATNTGLMSYRGGNGQSADFTPVQDRKLADVKIRHAPMSDSALAANARAEEAPPRNVDEPASKISKRRAQR